MGQPIGSRYELEDQLGRGAFGSVWRGRVRETGEAVAIKVLLEELAVDADVVTRFLRERTALVGLRHRSLVSVRDLVVEGDVLALVMQLVEGPDLRAYLRGRGTLGPQEAALLVADVAEALAVAHVAKIIHRDVKPANVLLKPEDGGFRPLLTDFGIARLADAPSVTRTSQVVGTPYYLSPEVISGRKATSAVDVYASGIMFYELLTGHPPFRGRDAMEVFRAHQTDTAQRPAGVPDQLWEVALAALAKDPERRPGAGELAARLRAAVRVNQDGVTVRLPVKSAEGTVVLPALPADLKIAAGGGAPGPGWPPAPDRRAGGAANAAARPGAPSADNAAPPQLRALPPQAKPPALPPASTRAPIAAPYQPQRPAPAAQQYTPPAPNQTPAHQAHGNPYAPYQHPRQPVPAQYTPQPNTYQQPRNKAPRHPQTYAPSAPVKSSGLSCLSKLAILVIVLAIAIAAGVAVGKQIARHHTVGRGAPGPGQRGSTPVVTVIFEH